MNTKMIASAILGLALLSTPVLAAAGTDAYRSRGKQDEHKHMTSAEQCMSLQAQFDAAIKNHAKGSKVAEAKTLRTDGGKLCASGRPYDGVVKLQQALDDIGVAPTES